MVLLLRTSSSALRRTKIDLGMSGVLPVLTTILRWRLSTSWLAKAAARPSKQVRRIPI